MSALVAFETAVAITNSAAFLLLPVPVHFLQLSALCPARPMPQCAATSGWVRGLLLGITGA